MLTFKTSAEHQVKEGTLCAGSHEGSNRAETHEERTGMPPSVPPIASQSLAWGLLLVLSGSAAQAQAADSSHLRLITVTGQAEVRVVPDEGLLTLTVSTFDPDLERAVGENERRVERVLAAAKRLDLEPRNLQTDYFEIEPHYRTWQEIDKVLGYRASRSITITLRDLTRFDALIRAAIAAGVTAVEGVDFRTTELRKHRDEARRLALRAAREKAEAMAETLGGKLGRLHSIEEPQNWWSGYYSWWGRSRGSSASQNVFLNTTSAPAEAGTLAPGQIAVTAQVVVRFELE
jgi:uncharacterized protein YggE